MLINLTDCAHCSAQTAAADLFPQTAELRPNVSFERHVSTPCSVSLWRTIAGAWPAQPTVHAPEVIAEETAVFGSMTGGGAKGDRGWGDSNDSPGKYTTISTHRGQADAGAAADSQDGGAGCAATRVCGAEAVDLTETAPQWCLTLRITGAP